MWNGWPVEELMSILILEQFAAVIGWLHLFGFEQISLQPFHIFPQLRKGSLTLKSDAFVWWFFSWLDIWMIFESAVHPLASPNCGGFSEDPSFHLLQKTRIPMVQKWQPSSTTDHTKAATDLRSRNHRCFSRPWHSSWHCRTMGVSKSYGASFWCPSDIILICTKKWLLCMTSLPYELVCSQNQLLSQIDCSLEKVSSVKLDITNSRNIL